MGLNLATVLLVALLVAWLFVMAANWVALRRMFRDEAFRHRVADFLHLPRGGWWGG